MSIQAKLFDEPGTYTTAARYTDEFKQKIADEHINNGVSLYALAKTYGIAGKMTVRNWVTNRKIELGLMPPAETKTIVHPAAMEMSKRSMPLNDKEFAELVELRLRTKMQEERIAMLEETNRTALNGLQSPQDMVKEMLERKEKEWEAKRDKEKYDETLKKLAKAEAELEENEEEIKQLKKDLDLYKNIKTYAPAVINGLAGHLKPDVRDRLGESLAGLMDAQAGKVPGALPPHTAAAPKLSDKEEEFLDMGRLIDERLGWESEQAGQLGEAIAKATANPVLIAQYLYVANHQPTQE